MRQTHAAADFAWCTTGTTATLAFIGAPFVQAPIVQADILSLTHLLTAVNTDITKSKGTLQTVKFSKTTLPFTEVQSWNHVCIQHTLLCTGLCIIL